MAVIMVFSFLGEKFDGVKKTLGVLGAEGIHQAVITKLSIEYICLTAKPGGRMGVRIGNESKPVEGKAWRLPFRAV